MKNVIKAVNDVLDAFWIGIVLAGCFKLGVAYHKCASAYYTRRLRRLKGAAVPKATIEATRFKSRSHSLRAKMAELSK